MKTPRIRLLGLWIVALVAGFGTAYGGSSFVTRKTCKALSKQYVAFAENGCGLLRLNTKYSRGCGNVQAHAGKNYCLFGHSEAFATNGPGGGMAWADRKGSGWAGVPTSADVPEDSVSTNWVEAGVVFETDRQVVTVNLTLAALAATTNGAVSQLEVILWREDYDGDDTLTPSKMLSYGSLVVKDGRALAGGSLEGIALEASSAVLEGFPASAVEIRGQALTLPVAAGTDFDSLAVTIRVDGGHGEITPASDWTRPGYEWTPLAEGTPPARQFAGLAEDGVRGRIVLFGGRDGAGSSLNDTWEWIQPNGPWQQVATSGLLPQPCQQHAVANLFGRRFHTVVFGGLDPAGAFLRDTWAWDGGAWQLLANNGPSHRAQAAMAPDQSRQRVLLFGGIGGTNSPLGDTWSWDGTAWSELNVPGPSPRSGHAMAHNPFVQRIVLFGGEDASGLRHDTWEWDGSRWTLMSSTGPPARRDFAMARKDNRIALFGGTDAAGQRLGDTWEWNGTNWIKTADDCPTPRSGHAMSSDAFWGSPLLFGGADAGGARDDAWRLHGVLIRRQPAALSVDAGQPAAFTVELTAGATTPAYQWERDCGDGFRPIVGATNSTHAIAAAAAGDACQYRCVVVVAGCLVASQPAALGVRVVATPPMITVQPQNLTVTEGQPAEFQVTATADGPLSYQWERDCGAGFLAISAATNAAYALAAATLADACQYRCVVTALGLSTASGTAALTVQAASVPPVITQQPEAVTVEEGDVATFSVSAAGAEPLLYRWLLDDVPIQDATNAVLLLGPVTADLSGIMTVRISNSGGALSSQGVPLTVVPLANNATGTRVPVDATVCFSNAGTGAVADCIADWAALGRATFQGGSYSAMTVHTRQARWCPRVIGSSTIWWPCNFNDTSDPTVPISAGGPVAGSGTGVTSINTPLLLLGHAAYWQDHCTVWPPRTFPPIGWEPAGFGYVHQVNIKMRLGNGDEYVFAPRNTPPLGSRQLTPACPPESMTICECPTVVELCFVDCATGLPVAINGDSFTATIVGGPFNGVLQAFGIIGNATCRKILLRIGEQYSLTMDYHTGTSYFTDRINWRTMFQVDTRSHDCASDGPLRVTVSCFRDPAGNCVGIGGNLDCPFGGAFGNLDMLCECEHDLSPNWSFIAASGLWNGALQHRWDHVGADVATGCAEGRFDLMNLPTSVSPSTYSASGRMSFRTGNSYQWLQTPASSFTVQCDQRVDLGDLFVLDCGWVKGDIRFCGPVDCCLLNYIYREPNPELTGSFLNGSSYIGASGPAGAQSRGHFAGSGVPAPGCEFLGSYSLSLGSLNKGVSTWTANQLVLRYLNASPHIDSTVIITDRLFPAQTIVPGGTVVNDLD